MRQSILLGDDCVVCVLPICIFEKTSGCEVSWKNKKCIKHVNSVFILVEILFVIFKLITFYSCYFSIGLNNTI